METANQAEAKSESIQHIDTLITRAKELENTVPAEAHHLATEALSLAEKEQYDKGVAHALCVLAWTNYRFGKYTEAFEMNTKAHSFAESLDDDNIRDRVLNSFGVIYSGQGEYDKAIEFHERALAIKKEAENPLNLAKSLVNMGSIYLHISDYSKALEYFLRALTISQEAENKDMTSVSYNWIGNTYSSLEEFDKAIENYSLSLAICEETGDRSVTGYNLANLGSVYRKLKDYNKALEYQRNALAIWEEAGAKNEIARSYQGIAIIHYFLEEYSQALEFYTKALTIFEETGNLRYIAEIQGNMAILYANNKFEGVNSEKAVEYFKSTLRISENIGVPEIIFNTHEELAQLYERMGDITSAYKHFKKFHELKEKVFNDETTRRIQNIENQQKLAELEKEREIGRREQKATFKILNRVLPRSIVDRVKNGEENIADKYPSASVLFADIVGFTPLAERLGADEVLKLLSGIFSHFDELCKKHGVEKIKTVGDSYMAASGVPVEAEDHLLKIAKLALAMQEDIKLNLDFKIPELSIRIGIHTGEVIAGVLGTQKLSYDIWGDTVNTAARMESHGEPDMIHCTEEVFKTLQDRFVFKERGEMEIKGKGRMKTYFLLKEK